MLTFKDFSLEQIYRAGPYVVSEDDFETFCRVLGGGSNFDMLSFAEQAMYRELAVSSLTIRFLVTGELKVENDEIVKVCIHSVRVAK